MAFRGHFSWGIGANRGGFWGEDICPVETRCFFSTTISHWMFSRWTLQCWGRSEVEAWLSLAVSLINPTCAILLLASVIKKHPRWNLSSPDRRRRTAFCKAKLCGSWMRDFCLETRGTWPWHTLAQLHLTSDCHLLSPNLHLTFRVYMQKPVAPQCMKYSRFCLCHPWSVLLPAGVVIELAAHSCPDTRVGAPLNPIIKYGGCSKITPVIVPVW